MSGKSIAQKQLKSFFNQLIIEKECLEEESQYSEHPGGWIEWFCAHEDHQFLCEVDDDFIRDPFNQIGIKGKFAFYSEAINMILQSTSPEDQDLEDERFLEVYQEASDIYDSYLLRKDRQQCGKDLLQGKFGHCPRIYCEKQNVIPIGLCEDLKTARVKVFCPRCEEVYMPKKKCADIDGAYFGKSFPQFLLMTYPDLHPKYQLLPDTQIKSNFEPTLFGFKIAGKQGSKIKRFEQQLQFNQIITQPIVQSTEQNILLQEHKQIRIQQSQQQTQQEQQQQQQQQSSQEQNSEHNHKKKNKKKHKN
ncbi:unnamed protein product (macronuclear) [Paramecium tetraurelia]|uniref:Casein kinase II subunit beta n=1 Tax=Paramecium tetraurelia TaxID=5888 RepID=A0BCH7_PARTE|nr:uncharacterized protein GSPATT00004338001 [Paramecium tetraurelia]CAK56244.1 unnamed protein product [Paramecium tetraurelia]|eukprot:XP_001423642.1 hypothetical protein (macronuclear) [Paramecium tetraurelia strain d4-2]